MKSHVILISLIAIFAIGGIGMFLTIPSTLNEDYQPLDENLNFISEIKQCVDAGGVLEPVECNAIVCEKVRCYMLDEPSYILGEN